MQRFTANLPKIGIRPTIDGRRESLEEQTMAQSLEIRIFGRE